MVYFQNFSRGDIVIQALFPDPQTFNENLDYSVHATHIMTTNYPIRTKSCNIPFDFYSNFPCLGEGMFKRAWFPFGFSSEDIDTITVFVVD